MASLRDSVYNSRPQRSWNPLERSNDAEYRYHSASDTAWSAYTPYTPYTPGDIGLGISTAGDEAIPVTDSRDSINSPSRSRNAYKTSPSPPDVRCPNRATVLQKRLSWIPLTVLILAVYATLFSGVYLVVAFWKPRWIHVSSDGPVLPSTARFLSSFFAKTIELSYVTVCVAFLGQVLSRRALMKNSRGISISDMNMRAWIMQPGSMIVHWEALRYSALTFLGSIALIATFVAMLYTTAAQALGRCFSSRTDP